MTYLAIVLVIWCIIVFAKSNIYASAFTIDNTHPLRGILALLIILHHVSQNLTYGIPEDSNANYLKDFVYWGAPIVAIFFFMSGYGLVKSLSIKGKNYINGFLTKRLPKILIPFIICSIIYGIYIGFDYRQIIDINNWKNDCPLLPTSWYVVLLLIYYIAFYISSKIFNNIYKVVCSLWIITILLIIILYFLDFKSFWIRSPFVFNIGMTISLVEPQVKKKLCNRIAILLSVLVLILLMCIDINITSDIFPFPLLPILENICISIIIWQLISMKGFLKFSILNHIGDISYEIYLFQGAVITILINYKIKGAPFMFILLSYSISILLAFILHTFLNKFVWKFRS